MKAYHKYMRMMVAVIMSRQNMKDWFRTQCLEIITITMKTKCTMQTMTKKTHGWVTVYLLGF